MWAGAVNHVRVPRRPWAAPHVPRCSLAWVGTVPGDSATGPRPPMSMSLVRFVWGPGWETNQKVISFQKLEPTVEQVTAFRCPCGFWRRARARCVVSRSMVLAVCAPQHAWHRPRHGAAQTDGELHVRQVCSGHPICCDSSHLSWTHSPPPGQAAAWPVSCRGQGRAVSLSSAPAASPREASGREWAASRGCSQAQAPSLRLLRP